MKVQDFVKALQDLILDMEYEQPVKGEIYCRTATTTYVIMGITQDGEDIEVYLEEEE